MTSENTNADDATGPPVKLDPAIVQTMADLVRSLVPSDIDMSQWEQRLRILDELKNRTRSGSLECEAFECAWY